jgi:hypothetical protein
MLLLSLAAAKRLGVYLEYFPLIAFAFAWILLELHKLPMNYLPQRYLLGLYMALGLFSSAVIILVLRHSGFGRFFYIVVLVILASSNLYFYAGEYKTRTYELAEAREYFDKLDVEKRHVLGSWSSSFAWGSGALTRPVWWGYFNHEDPLNSFRPVAIVSEHDQSESDRAYESQGIDLEAISDSVRYFDIWRYKVGVYWINQDQFSE